MAADSPDYILVHTTFFIFSYEYFYFDGRKKHKERAEIGREVFYDFHFPMDKILHSLVGRLA